MKCLVACSSMMILVLLMLVNPISSEQIILNEDTLVGTCTGTCYKIGTRYNEHDCQKIDNCKLSSTGWTRGFVRCDYCECTCQPKVSNKDVMVSNTKLSITEPDIYGTCTRTCYKSGLVRTNFKGCDQVKNCVKARNGWIRGFVRCDHCTCDCVKTKYAASYSLENIKYDLSENAVKRAAPTQMAQTTVENHSKLQQESTRSLSFKYTTETSTSSSHSLQIGLSVTVSASVGIPAVASLTTTIERNIQYGYTYTAGSSKQQEHADQLSAKVLVPPGRSIRMLVMGRRVNINIPYTATLVTKYKDGSTSRKPIKGVYSGVDFSEFSVQYEASKPL